MARKPTVRRAKTYLPSHAEQVNSVLFAISEAVNSTQDLDELYRTIHQVLGNIIDVTNFFIAIVDRHKRTLYFPYAVDTVDEDFQPLSDFDTNSSLTGLVVSLKKPVLLHQRELQERAAANGIWGPVPLIWMGVPLIIRKEVIGVIAVQNYLDPDLYDQTDLQLLTAISQQTAIAIDRKRSLDALKKREETYRNLFLNSPVGLFRIRPADGMIEECNDAMAKMLGFRGRQDCISRFSLTSALTASSDFIDDLDGGGDGEPSRTQEIEFERKDGSLARLRFTVRFDESQQYIEGVAEDITALKEVDEERRKLQEKLQGAKRMEAIGLLAGGVAHDLNNMLAGIINYPELMLMQLPGDHALVRPLKAVQESGKRIALVVEDLLTMARSAASIREIHDLNVLVEEYLQSPECRAFCERYPQLEIVVHCNAPRPNISCSPVHVRKCVMNLFTNAVEATGGSGTVVISTENRESAQPDVDPEIDPEGNEPQVSEWVVLEVKDNGRGIAAKDIEHIFEPFYTRKVMGNSGTGLGLTVVWSTVQDHQGKVRVASSDDGTCFSLLFPGTDATLLANEQVSTFAGIEGSGQMILIVDDEPQLREVACHILSHVGYAVHQTASGEAAVAYLKDHHVDLVVLDMVMDPGWNGRRTYEEILKFKPTQKAILVSGYSEGRDVKACLDLGVKCFLKKPYSLEQFCKVVHAAVRS